MALGDKVWWAILVVGWQDTMVLEAFPNLAAPAKPAVLLSLLMPHSRVTAQSLQRKSQKSDTAPTPVVVRP